MEEGVLRPNKLSNNELREPQRRWWNKWGKHTRFYPGSEYTGLTTGSSNTCVGDIPFYGKVTSSILSFCILKRSHIIFFCPGLRDHQSSTCDQIALRNLQSDVTEKKSDVTKVTHVSSFWNSGQNVASCKTWSLAYSWCVCSKIGINAAENLTING